MHGACAAGTEGAVRRARALRRLGRGAAARVYRGRTAVETGVGGLSGSLVELIGRSTSCSKVSLLG